MDLKPKTQDWRNENALREFRASLLPIVNLSVWNVKKYGAARVCPQFSRKINVVLIDSIKYERY